MSADNELILSNANIKIYANADKVITDVPVIRLELKEDFSLITGHPIIILIKKPTSQHEDVRISNAMFFYSTEKKRTKVTSDFRTSRIVNDIATLRHIQFDKNRKTYGHGSNPLVGKKEFTVVFTFSTNERSTRGSNYYSIPWLFGVRNNNSEGGFGIGEDKGNLYIWSGMGKGADI